MSESASNDNSLSTQSLTSGGLSDSDTSVMPAPYSYKPSETDSESSNSGSEDDDFVATIWYDVMGGA